MRRQISWMLMMRNLVGKGRTLNGLRTMGRKCSTHANWGDCSGERGLSGRGKRRRNSNIGSG